MRNLCIFSVVFFSFSLKLSLAKEDYFRWETVEYVQNIITRNYEDHIDHLWTNENESQDIDGSQATEQWHEEGAPEEQDDFLGIFFKKGFFQSVSYGDVCTLTQCSLIMTLCYNNFLIMYHADSGLIEKNDDIEILCQYSIMSDWVMKSCGDVLKHFFPYEFDFSAVNSINDLLNKAYVFLSACKFEGNAAPDDFYYLFCTFLALDTAWYHMKCSFEHAINFVSGTIGIFYECEIRKGKWCIENSSPPFHVWLDFVKNACILCKCLGIYYENVFDILRKIQSKIGYERLPISYVADYSVMIVDKLGYKNTDEIMSIWDLMIDLHEKMELKFEYDLMIRIMKGLKKPIFDEENDFETFLNKAKENLPLRLQKGRRELESFFRTGSSSPYN